MPAFVGVTGMPAYAGVTFLGWGAGYVIFSPERLVISALSVL
ncbi:hypothetical protein N9Q86_01270 [Porticoccaceae bacterium]|nr:hypothetical protein [Porticoccaceae bacterium]